MVGDEIRMLSRGHGMQDLLILGKDFESGSKYDRRILKKDYYLIYILEDLLGCCVKNRMENMQPVRKL